MIRNVAMKFTCIENISKTTSRLGQIILSEAEEPLKTPILLQTTKSGSIPHLSREVFDYLSNETQILQLSLATMLRMAESVSRFQNQNESKNATLSEFIGYKGFPTLLVMHDPCEQLQTGHNDKDVVPIFTRHGKEQITAKRYMDLVECLTPDFYEGLCDADTNFESSKKRIQKSFDRTENFVDYCLERHRNSEKLKERKLFAPIVGGYSTHARTKSLKHLHKAGDSNIFGYIFEGFHNYGTNALDVNAAELCNIVQHCISEANADKLRMMPGAYTPTVVLELITLGVDMFDTSYAFIATKYFKALSFVFELAVAKEQLKQQQTFLDMTDEIYKEDFRPFLNDCQCLTCRKHTRAYVHHLYKTKELLGPILLMIHNLHHYMEFFEVIRSSIANDTLAELLNLVKFQQTENEQNYRVHATANGKIQKQAANET